MLINKTAVKNDYKKILDLWDKSVQATHDFLTPEDKIKIKKELPSYFSDLDIQLWFRKEQLIGFSGRNESHLEMLFVDPSYLKQGFGAYILNWLVINHKITTVDVNEQNESAKTFYLKNGFSLCGRSAVDGQGRPYPLLHLTNLPPQVVTIRNHPELLAKAALWFSAKWDVPIEAYRESIQSSFDLKSAIPQWYVILDNKGEIIAGAGVIDNDFHERKDLSPNICALFVEELYRNQHLAKTILTFIRKDFGKMGFETLYLVTDHPQFYEKYDWQFLTMVDDLDGVQERLYTVPTF